MPTDEQLYEGKTERDLIIGLLKDMKTVKFLLQGGEGEGQIGLCTRVGRIENLLITHKVYFALMGAAIALGIPISVCLLNYLT